MLSLQCEPLLTIANVLRSPLGVCSGLLGDVLFLMANALTLQSSNEPKGHIDYAASVINSDVQTMTSLQIAEVTGRMHSNVMRDIRNLLEQLEDKAQFSFELGSYQDANGQNRPCYILTKEDCLLLASGYDANLRAKIIKRWKLLETERMVATPENPQLQFVQTQVYLAEAISRNLRLNEASRLGMYQSIAEPYRLAIPQYVPSKGVLKSASELLKEISSDISAIKFNQMLEAKGYVETLTRPASGGKMRRFKNITDKGRAYGENEVNPKNQKETQPHWYVDKFKELYQIVTG